MKIHDESANNPEFWTLLDRVERAAVLSACQCADVGKVKWRPSTHMPRWASRITLEITEVRVERVQVISTEDVLAEGVGREFRSGARSMTSVAFDHQLWESGQIRKFHDLWDEINGKKHPWSSNPWVWAVTFRRVD